MCQCTYNTSQHITDNCLIQTQMQWTQVRLLYSPQNQVVSPLRMHAIEESQQQKGKYQGKCRWASYFTLSKFTVRDKKIYQKVKWHLYLLSWFVLVLWASVTKIQLGSLNRNFSQFWRLQVQDQGPGAVRFWWEPSSWLADGYLLCAVRASEQSGLFSERH